MSGPSDPSPGTRRARVAVTGGVAEGKSTVLAELARLGWTTLSADEVGRQVSARPEFRALTAEATGADPDDREAVRRAISADPEARRRLNAVLHPTVLAELLAAEADAVEVPLLFEACLADRFDRVWCVTCGPEEQLRRLTERLGSEAEARALLASQLGSRTKAALSDVVLRTNRPLASVLSDVRALAREHRLR
jgi:dephospho-CoA kinase